MIGKIIVMSFVLLNLNWSSFALGEDNAARNLIPFPDLDSVGTKASHVKIDSDGNIVGVTLEDGTALNEYDLMLDLDPEEAEKAHVLSLQRLPFQIVDSGNKKQIFADFRMRTLKEIPSKGSTLELGEDGQVEFMPKMSTFQQSVQLRSSCKSPSCIFNGMCVHPCPFRLGDVFTRFASCDPPACIYDGRCVPHCPYLVLSEFSNGLFLVQYRIGPDKGGDSGKIRFAVIESGFDFGRKESGHTLDPAK